jgi:hypothetical protein
MRNAYKILIGKVGGRRPLGRSRHIQEDNTEMDLKEIGCEGMDWVFQAWIESRGRS